MRVTVIIDDAAVYVDGEPRRVEIPKDTDPNWRAVQWYGTRGDVEVREGSTFAITDVRLVQPFIHAFEQAGQRGKGNDRDRRDAPLALAGKARGERKGK